ncbi:large conductance mechanosensitive channel protein MscL [Synergistes jonesii]|uniref:Large-conductance mechanosensitive channel n=1 Tax=Synergistes jonesii TaxID=2754 RepID=A0A073IUT8_9BACT|nr:large conductance mechanosensitive channel protein MscL [Synergistes jonesii]KEJ93246.1 mechanosensitive ion channel protein MscL [Synergistes jonesii]OFB63328.1 mechanosensitive ion channel protein MscL [Synergistes jonesii]OFB64965.1 mechanosensitive ion channel protein MscL [Synergistes jonesii]OFB66237.1 mechanosensitive ion channel protein MscL [Synergistes jonesii]OFB69003.1 mechanosensitive ion channel protein MscL [Synergistes jonesii]
MSGLIKEFKDFAMRGNVMDMAVGVIIGGAFGKIVASLVSDILMPPIGYMLGGVDFSNLFINLGGAPAATLAEAQANNIPVIAYGSFINNIINFIIQAWAIFIVIKAINRMTPQKPEAPAKEPRLCQHCFGEVDERATRCPHCTSEL